MSIRPFGTSLVLALALIVTPAAAPATRTATSLTAFGTAAIDGVLSPGEWDQAATVDIAVNLPEGGTAPGRLYVMNDTSNLYLALRFVRAAADPGNSVAFEFDNGGAFYAEGSDVIVHNPDAGFFDDIRTAEPPCPVGAVCGFFDTTVGGTNDGTGAFTNDGTHSNYELSHPLDSADDVHDFSLAVGDHVGALPLISLVSLTGGADTTLEPVDIVIAGESHELVPCDGGWASHGEYVARVVEETDRLVRAGQMTAAEGAAIIGRAAASSCGK